MKYFDYSALRFNNIFNARFDMVDKKAADSNLNNDQRRNLAHIAKILQFAASKKGFATDSPHLEALNPFIIECHEKFKLFFAECCQVIIFHSPSSYVEHTIVVFLYAHWIALVLHFCSVPVLVVTPDFKPLLLG